MSDFPLITSILKGEHRPLEPLAFEVMTESGMRTLRFTPDAARQVPLKRPMFKELRTAVFEVWQSASMAA